MEPSAWTRFYRIMIKAKYGLVWDFPLLGSTIYVRGFFMY
jgi:hypothetical protein